MADDPLTEAEQAFEDHRAFERRDDGFAVTTTPFDATVRATGAGGAVAYRVTVAVPTIDAVVDGEDVAPVVQEGWFETLELRVRDAGGVTRVDPDPPLVSLEVAADEVVVEWSFEASSPARGVSDAKALVDYVEGTYVQGIIPGYDYRPPVSGLIDRARDAANARE